MILLNSDVLYSWLTQSITATPDPFYASSEVLSSFKYSNQCVKLTTHLHLVLRLRMCAVMPLIFLYALMVWAGTTLPLMFSQQYC